MATSFLTSLNEAEFKAFLKEAIKEVLGETLHALKDEIPEILDIQQAAKFLHLKINTIYEKTSRKLLPHFKKGNKLYFKRTELEAWLTHGKVKTTDDLACEAATYTLTGKRRGG